jgi:hypothetical protein
MTFGDRSQYQETKLWGHPAESVNYQERVWARDVEDCGSCAATSCGGANHLEGLACVSNTRVCPVSHGSGVQSWAPALWFSQGGTGWGACTATSCDAGYRMTNGVCTAVSYSWSTSAWGACGGGSATQSYGAWGACGGGSGNWSYGAWGACSASAVCSGNGTQTRGATCEVNASSGSQSRTGACAWAGFSGTQTRTVSCRNNFGEPADAALCGAAPATAQACTPPGAPASCGALVTVQACTPTGTAPCGASQTSQSCQSPAGSQSCLVANGTGTQSCSAGASVWGACTMTSCNPGYVASGGACVTDTGPNSCLALLNAGQTTSGLYTIDPDGNGSQPSMTVYCDMTTAGGGWTLISNRRANTTNTEACGANIAQFFTAGCGTASSIGASNSYAMTQAQRNAVPKTQMMVTQYLNGVLDSDDAYIVDLASSAQDLFPNTAAVQQIPLAAVCNLTRTSCDTTDVYWKYIGDYWYHSSMCWSGSSGSTAYRGNYGVCPNGAADQGLAGSYPSSGAFGNRSG